MKEFTHIGQLHQVARHIKILNEDPELQSIEMPITFRGTPKLHGCNCGVEFIRDQLIPQSRSRTLSIQDDHYGFAKFVEENKDTFKSILSLLDEQLVLPWDEPATLFGEWIGPGIQAGCAINKLPRKQLVVFAAYGREKYFDHLEFESFPGVGIYNINEGPSYEVTIDFNDQLSYEQAIETITKLTKEVEDQCPWGKLFGIEGIGEGIVWKPLGKHWGDSRFFFKSKGGKHKGNKAAKVKIAITPEVLANIEEFIQFSCTTSRLEQGLEYLKEQGLEYEMKNMGAFLKWMGNDIQRECALELEDNKLEWKQVAKQVTSVAKEFYVKTVEKI